MDFIANSVKKYISKETDAAPLAIFRILFGSIMLFSSIRFWLKGWIHDIYIEPDFYFKYYGFEWIKDLGEYTYLLFFLCGIASFCLAIGYKYRLSTIIFFLSFTYIELIDKTTYLNHYYFVSVVSFILIFIPAHAKFSLDNLLSNKSYEDVPAWTTDAIKIIIFIVYFYAGLSKINSDWLFEAMPLSIWLKANYDLPVIGFILEKKFIHYIMSWGGMLFDISIGFMLLYAKTRSFAYFFVVVFHLITAVLFPIGMFPYLMIFSTIIFFNNNVHNNIANYIKRLFTINKKGNEILKNKGISYQTNKFNLLIVSIMIFLQILFPFRHLFYDDELFWTEEGYRFSWRVMLIEKMGYSNFTVIDQNTKNKTVIDNNDFLTPFQQKQMSFQPDFILEYAHFLGDYYKNKGYTEPAVYVDSFVTLNGRSSQRYISQYTNLYKEKESFKHKRWILPFNDEIKGF